MLIYSKLHSQSCDYLYEMWDRYRNRNTLWWLWWTQVKGKTVSCFRYVPRTTCSRYEEGTVVDYKKVEDICYYKCNHPRLFSIVKGKNRALFSWCSRLHSVQCNAVYGIFLQIKSIKEKNLEADAFVPFVFSFWKREKNDQLKGNHPF